MSVVINAKQLRADLPRIVEEVRRGNRFTVLYRSRPAFDIVPPGEESMRIGEAEEDSLYGAPPVGSSRTGDIAARHDEILYP